MATIRNGREYFDLSPDFQDILRRNGLQAHVTYDGGRAGLLVQGHDSPLMRYDLSPEQVERLTHWGTNSANRQAYQTLVDILSRDFDVPRAYVNASNANGAVVMGLHGYRLDRDERMRYGCAGTSDMRQHLLVSPGYSFLGWTPRNQPGYHIRRMEDPFVAERPDGSIKPGELRSGTYGFYYKGGGEAAADRQQAAAQSLDLTSLLGMQELFTPYASVPRSEGPAIPLDQLCHTEYSAMAFSAQGFEECLRTHGLVLDKDNSLLIIQSDSKSQDVLCDLSSDELSALTDGSLENVPLQQRVDILNSHIREFFTDGIDTAFLSSDRRLDLMFDDAALDRLTVSQGVYEPAGEDRVLHDGRQQDGGVSLMEGEGAVSGRRLEELSAGRAWYQSGSSARVDVTGIDVQRTTEGQYRMSAVINGREFSHEITERQYEKFLSLDEMHQMRMMDRIFPEVSIHGDGTRAGQATGMLVGALLATAAVAHDLAHHTYAPEIYMERHVQSAVMPVYVKPGVDSPQDVASRMFELERAAAETAMNTGRHL